MIKVGRWPLFMVAALTVGCDRPAEPALAFHDCVLDQARALEAEPSLQQAETIVGNCDLLAREAAAISIERELDALPREARSQIDDAQIREATDRNRTLLQTAYVCALHFDADRCERR